MIRPSTIFCIIKKSMYISIFINSKSYFRVLGRSRTPSHRRTSQGPCPCGKRRHRLFLLFGQLARILACATTAPSSACAITLAVRLVLPLASVVRSSTTDAGHFLLLLILLANLDAAVADGCVAGTGSATECNILRRLQITALNWPVSTCLVLPSMVCPWPAVTAW